MNEGPSNSPVFVLLVDDLEQNLLALEAILQREGLVLLKALSGVEALEYLLRYDVALALVDVKMPEMDGFELAELIRGTERFRGVPIMFLTAESAGHHKRFQGYEAGAVDFLQKPLEPHILKSKVEVFIELYRRRQEVARQRDELRAAQEENERLLFESRQYGAALEEANRRKDEFLAMLAHELRNPLAAISNAVQLSIRSQKPEHQRWATEVVRVQTKKLGRLIDDLLDVSRITRGKIELKRERIDPKTIVDQAEQSVMNAIAARGHELYLEYGHGDARIEVDPTRFEQVIVNLLSNAAKYTPNGGRIWLMTRVENDSLLMSVKDSGVGMAPDLVSVVFELFTQGDRSMARSDGGLGIGLTLVKALVEMHGGRVSADSAGPGQGSTFTVQLPLVEGTSCRAEIVPLDDRSEEPSESAIKQRVLVVDDNVDTASGLASLLELSGHEVDVAYDGKSAIALAKANPPETVILDIGLPGMDGYQVAECLRQDELCRKARIIAVTGYGQHRDRIRAMEAGFDHHFVKPIDVHQVLRLLDEGA